VANTVTYNKHDYVVKLRQRLNRPTNWADVFNVHYSDNRTIVNSTLSTEPTVVAGTRGTAYAYQDFALTADTLTISTYRNIPIFIDEADRHQQTYFRQMEIADFQGKKINERIEVAALAEHASWQNFGVGDLNNTSSNDTAQITVSASNVDDLIRAVKRKIYANNGVELSIQNGFFFIWRPADYELLEAFVQANGFSEADVALKNGVPVGMRYMGVDHYLTNDNAANHLFAGVKKMHDLGILRSTYGKVKFLEDPATADGALSGLGIVSRVDIGFQISTPNSTLSQDINVV